MPGSQELVAAAPDFHHIVQRKGKPVRFAVAGGACDKLAALKVQTSIVERSSWHRRQLRLARASRS
jgi:hypothetical protein